MSAFCTLILWPLTIPSTYSLHQPHYVLLDHPLTQITLCHHERAYPPAYPPRLIIGDVGFGKTEVAMRAAYLAVRSNKQVD